MAYTALYDACVLHPAPLRDLLMQLALTDLFRAKWSNAIHDEWIKSVLERRPDLKREQLERTRELMNSHIRDSLVVGYEPLIGTLKLPDPNDRHVVAAAIHARADVIITFNLADFPTDVLRSHGLEAQHPDEFISHLADLSAQAIIQAAGTCRARLKHPPKSVEEYLECIAAQNLPQTVAFLRQSKQLI